MDTLETINLFIKNFVAKDKQDRTDVELKNEKKRRQFANRLNHNWHEVLDMRYITRITDSTDDFEFAKRELTIKNKDKCYLISTYDNLDDQVMEFKEAFDKSYGRGFATLIMCLTGNKLFLETEIGFGRQNRFIGKR